jgi:hypothetical protein
MFTNQNESSLPAECVKNHVLPAKFYAIESNEHFGNWLPLNFIPRYGFVFIRSVLKIFVEYRQVT